MQSVKTNYLLTYSKMKSKKNTDHISKYFFNILTFVFRFYFFLLGKIKSVHTLFLVICLLLQFFSLSFNYKLKNKRIVKSDNEKMFH